MTCSQFDRLAAEIADYLAGTLDDDATTTLQGHLAACPACRAEVDGLASLWAGLGLLPDEEPSEALRARFYARLESELAVAEGRRRDAGGLAGLLARWWWPGGGAPLRQALAAAALVAVGVAVGAGWRGGGAPSHAAGGPATSGEVAELRGEVQSMGRLLALSLLSQDSASERLKGVRWSERSGDDAEVTTALLATLNEDPNVNVRLAAVEALERYADRPTVADGLTESLQRQTSPLVQLALVDAVVATAGRGAEPALKALLREPGLDRTVRQRTELRLAQLG